MKHWWPHTEAIIATLLAYHLTADSHHAERFQTIHDWSRKHLAEPEHGEWYGDLYCDGIPVLKLKSSHWKSPYHLPRMLWVAVQILRAARG